MAKPADERIKASCIAAVAGGMSLGKAAEAYGVSKATVIKWRDQAGVTGVLPVDARARVSAAIAEYLLEALKAMIAQARLAQDDIWLRNGNAADLAALHTRVGESIARIVAAQREPSGDEEEPIPIRRAS